MIRFYDLVTRPTIAMSDSCGLVSEVRAVLLVAFNITFQALEVESGASFSRGGPRKGEQVTVRVVTALRSYHVVGWLAVVVPAQAGCVPAVVHGHLLTYNFSVNSFGCKVLNFTSSILHMLKRMHA